MRNMNYNNPLSESFREVQECFEMSSHVPDARKTARVPDAHTTRMRDARIPRMRTVHEAALELKKLDEGTAVTEYHIRQLAINNIIPRVKAGKKYLINLDALIAYLSQPHNERGV